MSGVFAIDPGNVESAYVLISVDSAAPVMFAKLATGDVRLRMIELAHQGRIDKVSIEMIASYGMPVGAEVFDTCVWIGHLERTAMDLDLPVERVFRREVKLHHCHTSSAKDSNVAQALKDRFAPGQPNHGKGTKAAPGWFYGFHKDVWQAYALGVREVDRVTGYQP